ncbi:Putative aldo/keto reductase, aldo-keto reductase, NADP-dependent oxidoreductase [Septoria linicola]|uniref:Aldo/keto reductase, aldo-keto reductase, NADP-dependent oxidoreductase n=1 Tax=Septoria linicola TaxID=215465 RepID=A0A9Q9ANY9_9PEZI|nr:putative aldo/keto reductase, aldo-keto reductase, NADP-dependent oxidoreductase [Septoria linicola]USW52774.1 Putative aldo/keto reductase, aldo-keto reductase, NADP-dependent oxidoreductase [Septoria linicola]
MKSTMLLLPLAAAAVALEQQIPLNPSSGAAQPLTLDAIPLLGFGTWNLKEGNTSEAVSYAIEVGYRHIDGAAAYGNEEEVGKGIAAGLQKTGLKREDLWITSKLWNDHHAPEAVQEAIDLSLKKLGLDYLDLYHMHWPVASGAGGENQIYYLKTWEAMVKQFKAGKTRHIGVSNFGPDQLTDLLNNTSTAPHVHQFELHPYLQQKEWVEYHSKLGIHVTAYSPFAGTNPTYTPGDKPVPLLQSKVLNKIAKKRGCTAAQVALQWGMSRGTSVIPKSIKRTHIESNFHATQCVLKAKDLHKLEKLGEYHHRYSNPSKKWDVPLYKGLEDYDGKHKAAKWFKHKEDL